jgi:urease accessory protein
MVTCTNTATITAITTMTTDAALFDLLTWMSPAWPVGAFAYSGGIEYAVEAGHVIDRATAEAWIGEMLDHGSLWNDAVLLVHAWRATDAGDGDRLADVAELAAASLTSFERRLEATAQGAAFRRIAISATPAPAFAMLDAIDDADLGYPVAVGCLAAARGIPLAPTLTGWLHAAVSNLVSAALRLVPLGQTDGQRILAAFKPTILALAARAAALADDDPFAAMASATVMAEFATLAHETQYTRLFRT